MSDASDRDVDRTRRKLLGVLGGTATVGVAGCSAIFGDDEDDDDDDDDDNGVNGENGNGEDENGEPVGTNADKAQAAWQRVLDNPELEAEDVRNQAYVEMEEAARDDMIFLPLYHGETEWFWYDWVDTEPTGPQGNHHQMYNRVSLEDDDELNLINGGISTLDPIQATDTESGRVINQVFDTLTHFPNGGLELDNRLLEEFELSDDGLTYTLTIKDGVEFHDGTELTADDVKYSFERLALSEFTTRDTFILDPAPMLGLDREVDEDEGFGPYNAVPDSLGIEVIDDTTLEITLMDPNPIALEIISYDGFAIVPEGHVGDHPDYDGEVSAEDFGSGDSLVGSGPFEFDVWSPEEEAVVTRNDAYHGTVANVETVHWEVIVEDEAHYTYAVPEENADMFEIPTPFYDRDAISVDETDDTGRDLGTYELETGVTANYARIPETSTFYFGMNARQTPKPVRQAIAYVTDHEEIVQSVFEGRGIEAFSYMPSALWPDDVIPYDDYVAEWPYSPNETDIPAATEVLEDAGYTPDDPFELTITTYAAEVFVEAAELTRDKLAGQGIEADHEEAPFASLLSRGQEGDLQVYSLGWIWSWPDPSYGLYTIEPKNTDTGLIPTEANGFYLDWQVELDEQA